MPTSGIDLVAAEAHGGGLCAIQCKFFAADQAVPKRAIDSFMSASEPTQFTSRLLVNTGQPLRHHALRVLLDSPKPCKVLDRHQLAGWDVDWSRYVDRPADLQFNEVDRHRPYPYQREAIDHVRQGFAEHARGQLVLPCGTGKTEVNLWLSEEMVGAGGRVLYLVPSIALMAQTMRVWAEQKNVPHRYVGICSDTRTGRTDEDVSLLELDFPVTTAPARHPAGAAADDPGRADRGVLYLPIPAPDCRGPGRGRTGFRPWPSVMRRTAPPGWRNRTRRVRRWIRLSC